MASVVPIAQRRLCRNRSNNGPISGDLTVKSAIVSTRNSATWPRASPVGMLKMVPTRDSVSAVSPAVWTAFSSTSRAIPDSPAPQACVKTLKRRTLAVPARPTRRVLTRPERPAIRTPNFVPRPTPFTLRTAPVRNDRSLAARRARLRAGPSAAESLRPPWAA